MGRHTRGDPGTRRMVHLKQKPGGEQGDAAGTDRGRGPAEVRRRHGEVAAGERGEGQGRGEGEGDRAHRARGGGGIPGVRGGAVGNPFHQEACVGEGLWLEQTVRLASQSCIVWEVGSALYDSVIFCFFIKCSALSGTSGWA